MRASQLLRRQVAFRALLWGRVGSAAGTYLAEVALMVDVWERTHDPRWISFLLVALFLPSLFLPVVAGPILDRWSRKRVMIGSDLVNLAVFCLLPFTTQAWQIVVLLVPCGFATGLFTPSVYAGLPNLVAEEELAQANSLLQTVDNFAKILGPVAGGALVAATGAHPAYLVNAASFALSAFWISRIPAARLQQQIPRGEEGYWRSLLNGFAVMRRTPAVVSVVLVWSTFLFGGAAMVVVEVVMARDVLHGGSLGYGLLMASVGCGLIVGALKAPRLIERFGVGRTYPLSIAACGLTLAVASFSPSLAVLLALMVLLGLANGVALVSNSLTMQRSVDDQTRGRVMATIMGLGNSAFIAGLLSAGPFADRFGVRHSWLAAALVMLVAAGLAQLRAGHLLAPAESPAPLGAPVEAGAPALD